MEATPKKKTDVSKIILVLLVVILLGLNGYQYFLQTKSDKKNQELTTTVEQKDERITKQEQSLDSLGVELQKRYEEIAELGGDTAALGAQIRQLAEEKRKISRWAGGLGSKIKKLEAIKRNYTLQLQQQDEELIKLRALTDSLNVENRDLKVTINENKDSINTLSEENDNLNTQVELGRILKAENFKIFAIDKKGKERIQSLNKIKGLKTAKILKTKYIKDLRVEFNLAPNKIALVETKTVYMQLKQPDGNTLYDLNSGSGEFKADGQQLYYTMKQDVIYEREGTAVEILYNQPTTYKSGKYTVNIFCEGEFIGSGSFDVK